MTTQETPEPGTEEGRTLIREWPGLRRAILAIEAEAREAAAFQAVRDVAASREVIAAEARAAVLAELKPCPWCGHPPMCHKGQEGECPGDTLSDGGPTDG